MKFDIKKAVRHKLKARVALLGPAGSGKTYTALQIAQGLAPGGRYLVIDTECESASLYSDACDFDVLALDTHSPETYVAALQAAARERYDVVIVDSLTHAWTGKDGALEQVDNKARSVKGNSYVAWRDVTPMHNALVDAMLRYPGHLIATMRVKMAYELVDDGRGKKMPQKIGLQPIQRDGLEYEFTVICDLDTDHVLTVGKTRCSALDGKTYRRPGKEVGETLRKWLDVGAEAPARVEPAPAPQPAEALPSGPVLDVDAFVRGVLDDMTRASTRAEVDEARARGRRQWSWLSIEQRTALQAARESAEARIADAEAQ